MEFDDKYKFFLHYIALYRLIRPFMEIYWSCGTFWPHNKCFCSLDHHSVILHFYAFFIFVYMKIIAHYGPSNTSVRSSVRPSSVCMSVLNNRWTALNQTWRNDSLQHWYPSFLVVIPYLPGYEYRYILFRLTGAHYRSIANRLLQMFCRLLGILQVFENFLLCVCAHLHICK